MFNAYKVAVKLSLVSNVAAGVASITSQFHRLNQAQGTTQNSLKLIERQMLQIKRLGLVGGAFAVAGGAGLSLFKGPIQAAMEYERAYTRFKTLNLGQAVNKQADSFARGTQAFGVSSAQLMDTYREVYGFFGDATMAQDATKTIAELNVANSNLFGGKIGKIDAGSAKAIMRFADMRGATNSIADFRKTIDLAQRMVTGSGGAMTFNDLEQLAKIGGTAFKTQNAEGLTLLSSLIQEQGGSRVGNSLMSVYQNIVEGRASNKALMAAQDLGLIQLVEQKIGSVGGKTQTRQVPVFINKEFERMLQTNTVGAFQKFVLPAIQQKYGSDVSDTVIAKVINSILSNRRASDLGVTVTTQLAQVLRDAKLVDRAMGVNETIAANKNTASGKFADLIARWRDLMIEVGIIVLPKVIEATKGLIGVLKTVRDFAHEWPNLTRHLVFGFGMLSALVAAGGILALTATAIKGVGLALTLAQGGTLASGLGATALGLKAVGAAAATFLAVYAGYQIGKSTGAAIDNRIAKGSNYGTSSLRDWLDQSWLGKATGWFGYSQNEALNFKQAPSLILNNEQSGFIRTAADANAKATINNKIVLPNGRVLAEVVTEEQAREAKRPQSSASTFDGRMHPAWPGMSYTPR